MKTYTAKPLEVERKWFVIDAKGKTLGRLATLIAILLRGKHKPEFVPNLDVGDYVVVINCEKIHVTGRRLDQKLIKLSSSLVTNFLGQPGFYLARFGIFGKK